MAGAAPRQMAHATGLEHDLGRMSLSHSPPAGALTSYMQHNVGSSSSSSSPQPPQSFESSTAPSNKLDVPRRRGIVKFFNSLKGFGFVVDNDPGALGGQEVFCHFSAIAGKGGFRSLAEGEEVEYELVQGPKGFQAANLTGPGGRNVVGDPKARLPKPVPSYMPFAPMHMGSFIADPYHQHPGMFAPSPYTQHVVYVPSSVAVPSSQYAYVHPTMLSPQSADRAPASRSARSGTYSTYSPNNASPSRFGPSPSSNGPPPAGYEPRGPQPFSNGPSPGMKANGQPTVNADANGYANYLPQSPPSLPTSFGFSPFSPPAPNPLPLAGPRSPPGAPRALNGPPPVSSYSHAQSGSTGGYGAKPGQSAKAHGYGTSSALFGTGPGPLAVGTIGESPASRSGTPSGDRRGTPLSGTGSGSSANAEWKAPVLYSSTNGL